MKSNSTRTPWFDGPVIVADFVAKSGLLELFVTRVGRAMVAIPVGVLRWLGDDVKTPLNSRGPTVHSQNGMPVSGVIFVHDNEPFFWALVEVGGAERPRPVAPTPSFARPMQERLQGSRYDEPAWHQRDLTKPTWDEDEDWPEPR